MDFDIIEDRKIANKILNAKNNYDIFGINAEFMNAPNKAEQLEKLKKMYKTLSLKVHPDRNKEPNATEAFQRLSNAYGALTKALETATPVVIVSFTTNDVFNFFTKPSQEDRAFKCAATTKAGHLCRNIVQFDMDGKSGLNSKYCRMHQNFETSKVPKSEKAKVKCRATCKNGEMCGIFARENSPYCGIHRDYNPNVKQPDNMKEKVKTKCAAKTKLDKPCGNWAQENSKYCGIHRNYNPNK
jgi:hypothetical protein